ncbi:hypothetical protein JCM10207_003785 [Rhodosporidiobolus poonsookiae]
MSPSLPAQIALSFADSLSRDYISLYDSTSVLPITDDPRAGPGEAGSFTQFIHVVPQLGTKPPIPLKTPDLSRVGKRDPFEGPEFGEGEKIVDLTASDGATYSLVHNLHALFREHIMAVPHFPPGAPFRPQTSDLTQTDLEVAWRVVEAYEKEGREAVCFFNGGPLAGASQAHLHLQFTPFQHGIPPACEALARSLPFPPPSPSASSSAAQVNGDAPTPTPTPAPARLPLPWVQFYLPLPPRPSPSPSSSSPSSAAADPSWLSALHTTYTSLLTASRAFLRTLPASSLPAEGPKRDSYNLFLTSRHMHLVPRTSRAVAVSRVASKGQGSEDPFRLSLNGLLYLGYAFVASEEEARDLRGHGLARAFREAGYANEE